MMTATAGFDPSDLESKVKAMYRAVADNPRGEFHFEMGRTMAERLGYEPADLDRIPPAAIESFAGVGYYFDLADLQAGETVVDLGSGSGMDSFIAALKVNHRGRVIGIDMTNAQLDKAERLRHGARLANVAYHKGYIDKTFLANESVDVVISNGVINLAPDKSAVFREAARLLKPGGRLAISDIVTGTQLPESIVCNTDLWAACIGGAMQQDSYREVIESAGFHMKSIRDNPGYHFISANAKDAQQKWGVKSISILAEKA